MSRWVLAMLVASVAALQAQAPPPPPDESPAKQGELKKQRSHAATSDKEEVPPEEDTSLSTTEFSFNPLQSRKDVRTGDFYFKKKSYLAAARRYRDATKWDDSNSEAWLRLGEAEEKLKDHPAAREAYQKYLELASDAKNAAEVRKRVSKLR